MTRSEGVTRRSGKERPPRVGGQESNHSSWLRFPKLLDEPMQKRWPIAALHARRRSPRRVREDRRGGGARGPGFAFKGRRQLFTIDSY